MAMTCWNKLSLTSFYRQHPIQNQRRACESLCHSICWLTSDLASWCVYQWVQLASYWCGNFDTFLCICPSWPQTLKLSTYVGRKFGYSSVSEQSATSDVAHPRPLYLIFLFSFRSPWPSPPNICIWSDNLTAIVVCTDKWGVKADTTGRYPNTFVDV